MSLQHLSKAYGGANAVSDISLDVEDGEFAVILGPSGSGKTTLMRCLAGLETPDSGKVLIGGKDMQGVPTRERGISMVFQNYALFPLMTVRENIGFPLAVRKTPRADIEKRVTEVASRVGISALLDKTPRKLSGGEQQRVSIARALVRETSAILMDEPLSSLDAPLRAQLRMELKSLQRDFGRTIIYVTHDQVEAMTLADRIAVLNGGRLLQHDAPLAIYTSPASSFVAGFVGNPPSSLLRLQVQVKGEGVLLTGGRVELVPPPPIQKLLKGRGEVILAVRAEGIQAGASGEGTVTGVVQLVERLGASSILDLKVGEFVLRSLVPATFEAAAGDRTEVAIDFGKVSLFDWPIDTRLV